MADERGLSLSTIYTHLNGFIEQGKLALNRVVFQGKNRRTLKPPLDPGRNLKEVKDILGNKASYGEIRAVIAHRNANANCKKSTAVRVNLLQKKPGHH